MQNSVHLQQRSTERFSLPLTAIVKIREDQETVWKETAKLVTVSRNGAGFYLQKPCQIGHLASLIIPLPKHLRSYDHDKELFRVWGLIQHCYLISSDEGHPVYHVGVAFTGKTSPQGYNENPLQSYRLCGMNKDGLWEIVATQASFIPRRHTRFWVPIDVTLETTDSRENTQTENISSSGAAVFSELKTEVGDIITFKSKEPFFSSPAIVRNNKTGSDDRKRLHIEFIDSEFPIKDVNLPIEESEKN